jgi:hypothetical protein
LKVVYVCSNGPCGFSKNLLGLAGGVVGLMPPIVGNSARLYASEYRLSAFYKQQITGQHKGPAN